MTPSDFIEAVKIGVHDASIRGIEAQLRKPSGRAPAPHAVEVSKWFLRLTEDDRECLRKVVALSVHSAVFGMLTVLDGVRSIEERAEKGQLTLSFSDDTGTVRLNDPNEEYLHDIYQAKVNDDVFGKKG